MKIDCGNERAGFWWSFTDALVEAAKKIQANQDTITFQGIYAHCGNTYKSKSAQEVKVVREKLRMIFLPCLYTYTYFTGVLPLRVVNILCPT